MFVFLKLLLLLTTVEWSEERDLVNVNIIEIASNQRNIMRNMIGRLNSTSLNTSNLIQSKISSVENEVTLHRQHKMDQIEKLIEATAIELENIQTNDKHAEPEEMKKLSPTPETKINSTPDKTTKVPPSTSVPLTITEEHKTTTRKFRTTPTEPEETITTSNNIITSPTPRPVITRPVAQFRNPIYFRTCQEIFKEGFDISGMYIIDPDLEGELEPYFVYCSMSYGQGVTLVLIGEELEMPLEVLGDNRPGSYVYEPTYEPTFQQMAALADISSSCQQYIQYTCQGSKLLAYHQRYKKHRGWLVSRDDEVLINWGGAPTNSTSCECGVTGSCITADTKCNCDGPSSAEADQTDAGYLTDKNVLPIKRVYLGDAAGSKDAFLTLGGLECGG